MAVDLSSWRITTANDTSPTRTERTRLGGVAAGALRTSGLLVIATLAILVLLPAMIAAQPTFLG